MADIRYSIWPDTIKNDSKPLLHTAESSISSRCMARPRSYSSSITTMVAHIGISQIEQRCVHTQTRHTSRLISGIRQFSSSRANMISASLTPNHCKHSRRLANVEYLHDWLSLKMRLIKSSNLKTQWYGIASSLVGWINTSNRSFANISKNIALPLFEQAERCFYDRKTPVR